MHHLLSYLPDVSDLREFFILRVLFFLFSIINIVFFSIAVIKFRAIESNYAIISLLFLVIVIGIAITVAAFYFTYKYLLTDGISTIYKNCEPFFRKVCDKIVDKSENILTNPNNNSVQKVVNFSGIVNEFYGNKIPGSAKKGINFLLKRIPFADLFLNIKNAVSENDGEIKDAFYNEVDTYIVRTLLTGNSRRFILYLLVINIIIQTSIIIVSGI